MLVTGFGSLICESSGPRTCSGTIVSHLSKKLAPGAICICNLIVVELGTHLRKEFILSALRVSQYEPGKDGAMLVGESSELATGSTKLEIIHNTYLFILHHL